MSNLAPMVGFGNLPVPIHSTLVSVITSAAGLHVARRLKARSSTPFPTSNDLELALKPLFEAHGFLHHHRVSHPKLEDRFEYDFWRPADGVAVEVMGYRADDEVYKDIVKFHVHPETNVGVVWVPRWKWISARRADTNYAATMKALAFADSFMCVEALVAVPYDWAAADDGGWQLVIE